MKYESVWDKALSTNYWNSTGLGLLRLAGSQAIWRADWAISFFILAREASVLSKSFPAMARNLFLIGLDHSRALDPSSWAAIGLYYLGHLYLLNAVIGMLRRNTWAYLALAFYGAFELGQRAWWASLDQKFHFNLNSTWSYKIWGWFCGGLLIYGLIRWFGLRAASNS